MPTFYQAPTLIQSAILGITSLVVLSRTGLVSTWSSRNIVWQAIVPYSIESSIPQLSRSGTIDLIKDLNRRMRREFAQSSFHYSTSSTTTSTDSNGITASKLLRA